MLKKTVAFTVLFFILVCGNADAVRYLEISKTNNTVYKDNFQEKDMSDWTVVRSTKITWSLAEENGKYVLTTDESKDWDDSIISPGIKADVTNCNIYTEITPKLQWTKVNIPFRIKDSTTFYYVSFFWDNGKCTAYLRKRLNGKNQYQNDKTLSSVSFNGALNRKISVTVTVLDNTMKIFADNELIIAYEDTEDVIASGAVGIGQDIGKSFVHNYRVERIPSNTETVENKYKYKTYAEYSNDEINDFSDALFDFYGWDDMTSETAYFENGSMILLPVRNAADVFERSVSYMRKRFPVGTIEFNVVTAKPKNSEDYFGVSFGNALPYTRSGKGTDGYFLKVSKGKIEMEKWFKGECVVLGTEENKYIAPDEKNLITIKQYVNKDGGLDISVSVNKNEIISCTDTKDAILADAYISMVAYEAELKFFASDEKEKTIKQTLGPIAAAIVGVDNVYTKGRVSKINESDSAVVPFVKENTVMLPLKYFASVFGGSVYWNSTLCAAVMNTEDNELVFSDGYASFFLNGEMRTLPAAAQILNGTMFVPKEIFEEYCGVSVHSLKNGLMLFESGEDIETITSDNELLEQIITDIKSN